MDKIFSHEILHFDEAQDFTLDIDSATAERLKSYFNNEITIMHIISSGDTQRLTDYMANSNSDIVLGYSNTRLGNERAFIERVLTLGSIAAINGGVDCTVVYALIFKYQNIIENTTEPVELIKLSYDILRDFCNTVAFQSYKKCNSPVLLPVLRYIHSNLHTKITVEEVAKKLHMNANYLSQIFKKEMGENFSTYVPRMKIVFAQHLMETTEKSISEISEYLAFSSQSHFIRAFKNETGTTPKQYLLKVKRI